jgi:hypothetical protein
VKNTEVRESGNMGISNNRSGIKQNMQSCKTLIETKSSESYAVVNEILSINE